MLVKVHPAYRRIVAVCDSGLLGKKFEEGNRQLDLTGKFFQGEEKTEKEVKGILEDAKLEDALFNFVGNDAVKCAVECGIISKKSIIRIQGVPVALGLL